MGGKYHIMCTIEIFCKTNTYQSQLTVHQNYIMPTTTELSIFAYATCTDTFLLR
jgi:hypothetical protein